jgi:hypothetical protein
VQWTAWRFQFEYYTPNDDDGHRGGLQNTGHSEFMQLGVQEDFVLKFKSASLTQSNSLYNGNLSSFVPFTAGTVYSHLSEVPFF